MAAAPLHIAIIGGGFTGAAAAIALAHTLKMPFRLSIVEPDAQLGRGLAYGKAEPYHLLNVRAANLSVHPDQPGDFAAWAAANDAGLADATEVGNRFLPRQLFGAYVQSRLAEALRRRPDIDVHHIRSEALGLEYRAEGFRVRLQHDRAVQADIAVLALGYGRPAAQGRFGGAAFMPLDPDRIAAARTVLIVGTGLTFVDEWLRLQRHGFHGQAYAVSRRGLLPERHSGNIHHQAYDWLDRDAALAERLSFFRRAFQEAGSDGPSPGDLVAGLRDGAQALWMGLDHREQRRFLRHLRPYWDRLRHRVPPASYLEVVRARAAGSLSIETCRGLQAKHGISPALGIAGLAEAVRADLVHDCSGHRPAVAHPLISATIRSGLTCLDRHRLGVAVLPDGRALDRHGRVSPGLFALGPLGQGSLYEITAIKEIAAQCAAAARQISQLQFGRELLLQATG